MRSLFNLIIFVLGFFLFSSIVGCDQSAPPHDSQELGLIDQAPKVYFNKASYEQVADYVYECGNGNKAKVCVVICHRPPGNPENSHTKNLPLKAAQAHLHHGGPHHEQDYLGECRSEEEPPAEEPPAEEPPAEEPPAEEPPAEEPPAEEPPTEEPPAEIPGWCEDIVDIDSDCDGLIDETGEPHFYNF